jgi:hypothetical protein
MSCDLPEVTDTVLHNKPGYNGTVNREKYALRRTISVLACIWGLIGVLSLLGFAVVRLFDVAAAAIREPLSNHQ